jgi:hypothetical protein
MKISARRPVTDSAVPRHSFPMLLSIGGKKAVRPECVGDRELQHRAFNIHKGTE